MTTETSTVTIEKAFPTDDIPEIVTPVHYIFSCEGDDVSYKDLWITLLGVSHIGTTNTHFVFQCEHQKSKRFIHEDRFELREENVAVMQFERRAIVMDSRSKFYVIVETDYIEDNSWDITLLASINSHAESAADSAVDEDFHRQWKFKFSKASSILPFK